MLSDELPELLNDAVDRGCADMMNLLLRHAENWSISSALYPFLLDVIAAKTDTVAIGLICYGAKLNAPDDTLYEVTRLHLMIPRDDISIVRRLLDHGADPNAKRAIVRGRYWKWRQITPQQLAISRNNDDIAELLMDSGAEIFLGKFRGQTNVMRAVKRGNMRLAEAILSRIDKKPQWKDGYLPVAISQGNAAMVDLLLKYGPYPEPVVNAAIASKENGFTRIVWKEVMSARSAAKE